MSSLFYVVREVILLYVFGILLVSKKKSTGTGRNSAKPKKIQKRLREWEKKQVVFVIFPEKS